MAPTVAYISICVSYHCENIVEGDLESNHPGVEKAYQGREGDVQGVETEAHVGTESRPIQGIENRGPPGVENRGSLKSTVEVEFTLE